jgi:protoporphyrinogen oxidase
MTEFRKRVGIVGGGLLGMTLAHRMAAQGVQASIIEAAPQPGGLASSQTIGGARWDRFYHVILLSDRDLLALLEELGLGNRLRWGYTRSGFYTDGVFHSLSSSLDFLTFPPLRLSDKARLAYTILRASRIQDPLPLESETAASWLRRCSGIRTYERLWRPLLRSKLGENAEKASASFIWAIIARMYAARRSGLKREMFGYVDGGYAVILPHFREALLARGVEFVCGQAVAQVSGSPEGASVILADGSSLEFDAVILTVACPQIVGLCPELTLSERARLNSVVYQGIVCPSLLLRRPLRSYYVTSITDEWVPFTAVIEMTALVDRERFGGHSLIYLPRYLSQTSPVWQQSDTEIVDTFVRALLRMYPELRESDVVSWQMARAREVLAISTLNYSRDSLPPNRTSLPNVFIANSAQIAAGTLNVNETVALANRKAAELLPSIHRSSRSPVEAEA